MLHLAVAVRLDRLIEVLKVVSSSLVQTKIWKTTLFVHSAVNRYHSGEK